MIHVARSRNVLVGSTSGRASKLNPASTFSHALYNIIRTNIGLTDETRCALVREGSFLASQLTTIIHAGGRLNDATISNQTVGKFCSVSSPKFIGLQRMAEAMMNSYALDNFLLFSSIASLIGSPVQINYAMANGVMDEFAGVDAKCRDSNLSIQWGAWGEDFDGMTSGDRRVLTKMRHHGFGVLKPEKEFWLWITLIPLGWQGPRMQFGLISPLDHQKLCEPKSLASKLSIFDQFSQNMACVPGDRTITPLSTLTWNARLQT